MSLKNRTIAFTQPYVPAYRVPLFDELERQLERQGARLAVYSGTPDRLQAMRGDSATSGRWHRPLSSVRLPVLRWHLEYRKLPRAAKEADVLVTELEALNVTGWSRTRRQKVVLWGHGKPYVTSAPWLAESIEWSLVRRADHVMTYAPSGRAYLMQKAQVSPRHVTAIGNSTDTEALRAHLRGLSGVELDDLRARYGNGPTALFVGGLDQSKRIDFVLEAFRQAVSINSDFKLIVAGNGPMIGEVRAVADADARLIYYPRAIGKELAALGAVANALWMPGRVGLVAVDAIALGLDIHTTAYEYHAPEVEFLRGGEHLELPNDPHSFAAASLDVMSRAGKWPHRTLRTDIPTVSTVASRMLGVFESLFAQDA